VRIALSRRRFEIGRCLAGEGRDGFDERHTSGVLREAKGVATLAAASTVPKLFFRVDAEAIFAAADRTGPSVFAGANVPEPAEALSDSQDVGP
jgi:hypothetical protein